MSDYLDLTPPGQLAMRPPQMRGKRGSIRRTNIALGLIFAFWANILGPPPLVQAQEFLLPAPGVMVPLSPQFDPPILKGIKIHPDNPFRIDFILDVGDGSKPSQNEATRLIKYFLASLTIPENDLWVNLSPYEKNRIIPQSFGLTEMGRDLLAEDYMLKQTTSSLIYPEDSIGKKFWSRVYEEAAKKYGRTNIPVNTLNKVWVIPQQAVIYEHSGGTAFVAKARLKVMLEQDYLALSKRPSYLSGSSAIGSQVVREIIIPKLEEEINEGKNFSQLRQIYYSLILATWYKQKLKASILNQVYSDKDKIKGVDIHSAGQAGAEMTTELIYREYIQAFKKGVFNYIKEEPEFGSRQTVVRKYFSGGYDLAMNHTDLTTGPVLVIQQRNQQLIDADKAELVEAEFSPIPPLGIVGEALKNGEIHSILTSPSGWVRALGDGLIRRGLGSAIAALHPQGIQGTMIVHNPQLYEGLPLNLVDYRKVLPLIRDGTIDYEELARELNVTPDFVFHTDSGIRLINTASIKHLVKVESILKGEGIDVSHTRIVSLSRNGKLVGTYKIPPKVNIFLTYDALYKALGLPEVEDVLSFSAEEMKTTEGYLNGISERVGSDKTRFILINPGVGKELIKPGVLYRLEKIVLSASEWVQIIKKLLDSDPHVVVLVGASGRDDDFMGQEVLRIMEHFHDNPRVVNSYHFIRADWHLLGALFLDQRMIMQLGFESGTMQHLAEKLPGRSYNLGLHAASSDAWYWGGLKPSSFFMRQATATSQMDLEQISAAALMMKKLYEEKGKTDFVTDANRELFLKLCQNFLEQVKSFETLPAERQEEVLRMVQDLRDQIVRLIIDHHLQEFFFVEPWDFRTSPNSVLTGLQVQQTNFYKFVTLMMEQNIDPAMSLVPTGGIDLRKNPIIVDRSSQLNIKFNMDQAMLEKFQNADGLMPVIIQFEPVSGLNKSQRMSYGFS